MPRCLVALTLFALSPLTAQEKPAPEVVEQDLGDGFRAVSVNGGPPAIVDDETGLILKQMYGQPAVVDQESGAILTLDADGEPQLKFYGRGKGTRGKQGGGGDAGGLDAKRVERMKAFMQRARDFGPATGAGKGKGKGKGQGKGKVKPEAIDPIAGLLERLGVSGDEAAALRPLLAAVVEQRDAIRRSALPTPGTKARPAIGDLPAAIQRLLGSIRAGGVAETELTAQLTAYRAARHDQDAALAKARARLREVLTVPQEATLVAHGVLE